MGNSESEKSPHLIGREDFSMSPSHNLDRDSGSMGEMGEFLLVFVSL